MTRNQIKNKVRRVINKANKMWRLDVSYPKVTFYTRGNVAGWADCFGHHLAFNERIADLNKIDFNDIVIHEVAHLVTYKLFPKAKRHHGKEFMVVDLALGGGGFAHHELEC